MMIEEKLKQCIVDNYGTINNFCISAGMPNSTIFTVLRRGVLSTSTTTMLRICDELGISLNDFTRGEIRYVRQKDISEPLELLQYVNLLETSREQFTYKHRKLSREERQKLAFAIKVALEQL